MRNLGLPKIDRFVKMCAINANALRWDGAAPGVMQQDRLNEPRGQLQLWSRALRAGPLRAPSSKISGPRPADHLPHPVLLVGPVRISARKTNGTRFAGARLVRE